MKTGEILRINRTGTTAAPPELLGSMLEATRATQPSAPGDADKLARVRINYAGAAEPTGSIPAPHEVPERLSASVRPEQAAVMVFTDKLGERLAFERTGVRLYEALISKFDAYGTWHGGPSRIDLEEIRTQEHEHFLLLSETAAMMGADPTAVTPSANLHSVVSLGLPIALTDPRTNLRDGLEAILVAELVDNDGWENLSDLASGLGRDDLVEVFADALEDERDHLRRVRAWMAAALGQRTPRGREDAFQKRAHDRDRRMFGMAPVELPPPHQLGPAEPEPVARAGSAGSGPVEVAPAARAPAAAKKKPAPRAARAKPVKSARAKKTARTKASSSKSGRARKKPGRGQSRS